MQELEVSVTVQAVAKLQIGADGTPRVIGIEIAECRIAEAITPPAAVQALH